MPTGYTNCIYNNTSKVTAKEFLTNCSRAFGFMSQYRDARDLFELPEKLEVDRYYVESLHEAGKEYDRLLSMKDDPASKEAEFRKYNEFAIEANVRYLAEKTSLAERYDEMIEAVSAWSGTESLPQLKIFALEQLKESKHYDCAVYGDVYPIEYDIETWYEKKLKDAKTEYEYRSSEYDKEKKLFERYNKILDDFRRSLENV